MILQFSESTCRQSQNERGKHSNRRMNLALCLPHHLNSHLNTPRAENETPVAESRLVGKASRLQYLKIRFQTPRQPPHRLRARSQHLAQLRFHPRHPAQAGRVMNRSKYFLLQKMSRYHFLVRGDNSWPRPKYRLRAEDHGPLQVSPDRRPKFVQSATHCLPAVPR